jgi:hypothetical protein
MEWALRGKSIHATNDHETYISCKWLSQLQSFKGWYVTFNSSASIVYNGWTSVHAVGALLLAFLLGALLTIAISFNMS